MVRRSQTGKIDVFFRNFGPYTTVGLIETGLLFQGNMLACGWNLPYVEANGV